MEEKKELLVPAHPPSKADPAGALVGLIFALVALFSGIELSKYVSAEELGAILGGLMTFAAGTRAVWQRHAAKKAAGE